MSFASGIRIVFNVEFPFSSLFWSPFTFENVIWKFKNDNDRFSENVYYLNMRALCVGLVCVHVLYGESVCTIQVL